MHKLFVIRNKTTERFAQWSNHRQAFVFVSNLCEATQYPTPTIACWVITNEKLDSTCEVIEFEVKELRVVNERYGVA